jgi:hypothetical protein
MVRSYDREPEATLGNRVLQGVVSIAKTEPVGGPPF